MATARVVQQPTWGGMGPEFHRAAGLHIRVSIGIPCFFRACVRWSRHKTFAGPAGRIRYAGGGSHFCRNAVHHSAGHSRRHPGASALPRANFAGLFGGCAVRQPQGSICNAAKVPHIDYRCDRFFRLGTSVGHVAGPPAFCRGAAHRDHHRLRCWRKCIGPYPTAACATQHARIWTACTGLTAARYWRTATRTPSRTRSSGWLMTLSPA